MGVLFSCPVDDDGAVENGLAAAAAAGNAAEPTVLRASLGSGKLRIEGSLSFKTREQQQSLLQVETKISITSPRAAPAPMPRELLRTRFADAASPAAAAPESPKHEAAAVTLQKVYKSFRTRRRLADCAVLVEQSWWKLLDFALLKRSSVSFFDIEKQESAVSKWARARTRAAKVGKGLSKDDKAQKLALQHWLEAIDPRHRYGHNLHYYYDCWLQCESKEPFFYWLDVGEGKEINLEDRCPRWKLLSQCIKYLGPQEREDYEVVIEHGKFMYKNSRQILDTSGGPRDDKWIFVLSTSKNLYVGQKKKGKFQHSSFLAGGATSAAGRLVVEDGTLKAIWPHSGHYRPTEENFQEFQGFLKDNNVDLTDVKMSPTEGDEEFWGRLRSIPSDRCADADNTEEEMNSSEQAVHHCQTPEATKTSHEKEVSSQQEEAISHPSTLKILPRVDSSEGTEMSNARDNGWPEQEEANHDQLQDPEEDDEPSSSSSSVPREKILERINSKKEAKSYQLGKQLSFKWTTGAGPRIVCVRDYPSELQLRALEQVHLSPRSGGGGGRAASSRFASPQRSSSPMARGCSEPLTPGEAFRAHLQRTVC
ncbi:IQ domain-containing protein IQM2-like [Oryza brachyantha]|uniref:Uncharacterized protein n=1 Tax=Oryza brachyantha TaxID=4533 RepID=J3MNA6_ORYBR|nr:IQ domain-containing protein IQM2-like [Oryza brachyantha]